jgi:hypothetical protein
MAIAYGNSAINVSSAYVNSVQILGGTINSQGNDANGNFSIAFQNLQQLDCFERR